MSLLRILFRGVLLVMQLKVFKLYEGLLLLLYLLIRPCPVSYPVCLFSSDVDAQLSRRRLEAVQVAWFPIFRDFCRSVIIHLVYMVSPCSFPDSAPSYGILNLADVFASDAV